jgi:hypothetical protein
METPTNVIATRPGKSGSVLLNKRNRIRHVTSVLFMTGMAPRAISSSRKCKGRMEKSRGWLPRFPFRQHHQPPIMSPKDDPDLTEYEISELMAPMNIKELTIPEIEDLVDTFASAAVRAQKAGFDGVEANAARMHLINSRACCAGSL